MRVLSTLLVVVMFVHLHCGGSCVIENFGGVMQSAATNPEPSCHHHENVPANNDQPPSHDADNLCSRSQLIDFKVNSFGKVVLQMVGVLPDEVAPERTDGPSSGLLIPASPQLVLPPPTISVLRI
jgi:hypothetical protein